jgi:hypothetical protein
MTKNSKEMVPLIKEYDIEDSDTSLIVWNACPQCKETCPIFQHCPYAHETARCDLIYNFIDKQEKMVRESLEKRDIPVFKKSVLGIGVINLWKDWVMLEIIKSSLDSPLTNQGRVHPVFKESRETLKAIMSGLEFSYGKQIVQELGLKDNVGGGYMDVLRGD